MTPTKTRIVRIRLTPNEHDELRSRAVADGRSLSDYIRRLLTVAKRK